MSQPVEPAGSESAALKLRSILEGTASDTGEEFFRALVRHLARALGARYAFVGEIPPGARDSIRTLAVWCGDDFGADFEYALEGTPCERVVEQTACFYPSRVQQSFPGDRLLAEMGAESYLGTPLFDSARAPLGVLAVLHDAPLPEDGGALDVLRIFASRAGAELERKRAEEELRRTEERTRLIVDTAPDAVITIDSEGTITGWNPRAESVLGWPADEVIGKTLAERIIPPRYRLAHRSGLQRFLETGEGPLLGRRVEITALHRDGHEIPVELSIATIRTRDSYEFSAFVCDISERKRVERERRELEGRVQHAQKLESLGMLAGGIAHDFNNLLTGILGNLGAARRYLTRLHPAQSPLDEVARGSRLACNLTEQLLAYAGKGRVHSRSLDLTREVRGLEPLLRTSMRERASLEIELCEDLPPVEADPVQLHQVLLNLVLNAAEAGDGRVRVAVRTGVADLCEADLRDLVPGSPARPGRYAVLEVADDGSGMDEETRRHVFDPFFTTKKTGTGLGLAVILGIVHGCGGGVRLESDSTTGTRFQVLLPAAPGVADASASEGPVGHARGGRVLLVDDDEIVLQAGYHALESLGYSVTLAADGERALELVRAHPDEVDLVVLDLSMPGIGGERTFQALRRLRADLPILVSSAHDPEPAADLTGQPGTDLLRKPYVPDQLGAAVRRALDPEGKAAEAALGNGGALDATLESLRGTYRARLPERLAEIDAAICAARTSGSAAALRDAWRLAHRLKGTAGSYGFEVVASAAERIEGTLRRMLDGIGGRDADWAEIRDALREAGESLS